MRFDHVAWRTERADVHDTNRSVEIRVLSEMPGTLTIIGRAPSARQAVDQVRQEAIRQTLSLAGLPEPSDYAAGRDALDHWCAVTWVA